MPESAAYTVCLTHDVDRVHKTFQYLTHDVRRGRWRNLRGLFEPVNPYWTFDTIMDIEDQYGLRSTFFFLQESLRPDWYRPKSWVLSMGRYHFADEPVARIIRRLDAGGWEVGLHGSYNSYRDGSLLVREKQELERVLGKPVTGIRQHYLNLDEPATWQLQRAAGLTYDASFGPRNGIGFKDERLTPFVDRSSGMTVIPLPLMECYLLAEAGGDFDRAFVLASRVLDQAAASEDAVVTLLWHPHMFAESAFPGYSALYRRLIEHCLTQGAEFATAGEVAARNWPERDAHRPQQLAASA